MHRVRSAAVDFPTCPIHSRRFLSQPWPSDIFNTPKRRAYERLIRRVLALPQRPAVIALHYYGYLLAEKKYYLTGGGWGTDGKGEAGRAGKQSGCMHVPFLLQPAHLLAQAAGPTMGSAPRPNHTRNLTLLHLADLPLHQRWSLES